MASDSHLSIGEVLSLVQEEFPDVTISKIRFLESQGLLDPERTPSGYRKFYPSDIERLEWILAQQRDNFLPLKVIRERLDEWDATGTRPDSGPVPSDAAGDELADASRASSASDLRHAAASLAAGSAMEVGTPVPAAAPRPQEPAPTTEPSGDDGGDTPERWRAGQGYTADELADKAGVPVSVIHDLVSFSMIDRRRVGKDDYYDDDAVEVAEACRPFIDAGIEVRHLRMYKIAAEREAGMLEQLVMPLLKQRHPEARQRAARTVTSLADAGQRLHETLLQSALDDALG